MSAAGANPEPEASQLERQLAQRLAAFDESLAAGRQPDTALTVELPAEARQRLQRAQDCLQLLYEVRSSDPPLPSTAVSDDVIDASSLSGTRISHYEIQEVLGRGGMGIVYRARDLRLDRHVALKFLPSRYAKDAGRLDRFRHEARTASALNHPHICTLHDIGDFQCCPFLVMELIEGQTLRALIGERLSPPTLIRTIGQVAQALRVAHAHGIVHRDMKPENVMVRHDGYVKVLDFGLARLMPAELPVPVGQSEDVPASALVGTVRYMSPEQWRGEQVSSASDIFSLGITFYELATSCHPFESSSFVELMQAIESKAPLRPGILNAELPAIIEGLILQMLEKQPRLRPTAAEVEVVLESLGGSSVSRSRPMRTASRCTTVGRHEELEKLQDAFTRTIAGRGSIVCVAGEPGIGKTTMVEGFLSELAASGQPHGVGRGRCSERLAGAEAYLPILEAFEDLLRGPVGEPLCRLMKTLAPTWYTLAAPSRNDSDDFPVEGHDTVFSQEQLKRECVRYLEEASSIYPTLLFLDDLHWADPSTVDLLGYLGQTCATRRLLIIVTYRTTEMLLSKHPFVQVQLELQTRGVCEEIALRFLNYEDVSSYLAAVFPDHQLPSEFASLVFTRTEGNPLFMVDLLRYLRERQVVAQRDRHWILARSLPDLQREMPASTRSMIQKKIEKLTDSDHRLLVVASVQGYEFDTAVVARVLRLDPTQVEERLAVLDRVHDFVELNREYCLPDGTVNVRYRFIHVLYQNALYSSLTPTGRMTLSDTVAAALLEYHGDNSRAIAAELALLLEAAHDYFRAAQYFQMAAENAVPLFAHQEAVAMTRRGLALMPQVANHPQRVDLELQLQLLLAGQLQATLGFARPEVGAAFERARQLCEQIGDVEQLFPVIWGLWAYHAVRAEYPMAQRLAAELLTLAEHSGQPDAYLPAHHALGVTLVHIGALRESREQLELGWKAYHPDRYRNQALAYAHNLGAGALSFAGFADWLLGYPDQAVQRCYESMETVRDRPARAHACYFATAVHQCRREPDQVARFAEELVSVTTEHGFAFWRAGGLVLRGWARCHQGQSAEGIGELRQGLAEWMSTGAVAQRPYHLGLLAEALAQSGRFDEGLVLVDEALQLVASLQEGFFEAELHRLRGELLLKCDPASDSTITKAAACFRTAVAVALKQDGKSLLLRAQTSLYRLLRTTAEAPAERQKLADICGWFREGLETADLRDARLLLGESL